MKKSRNFEKGGVHVTLKNEIFGKGLSTNFEKVIQSHTCDVQNI